MGRLKTYQREDLARRAMALFWQHGFDGTSTQMLVDDMGVNRFSLYAEFGHKKGLFEAALALYEDEVVARNLAGIEAPAAGLQAIQQLFDGFAQWAGEHNAVLGCLICNTATELAAKDPSSQVVVNRYVARLSTAFAHCLQQAQADGQLQQDVDALQEGRFLATLLLGFLVQLRAQVPVLQVQASAQGVQAYLRRLTKPASAGAG